MRFQLLFTAVASLSLLLKTSLPAILNETPRESEARYGRPVAIGKDGSSLMFNSLGLEVETKFHGGKCGQISYRKAPNPLGGQPVNLTEAEIKALIKENGNGRTFAEMPAKKKGDRLWLDKADGVGALYEPQSHTLTIITQEQLDSNIAEEKARPGM